MATLKSHPNIKTHVVATGAAVPQEHSVIDSYLAGHPNTAGMFAVDGGSTEGVGLAIQKHNATGKVKGGGYDLTPTTEQLVSGGVMSFTIDQQPYLQGFLPILQMYMYNATQKLTGVCDVDTGLKFLDKTSMQPYVSTKSRYEGTGTGVGVQKA
jgi:simple sugar transport system substrate-binding protein